jgi:ABC-type transport system involved in cytochrome bd biosynthesis fused ATPase/permease subunit
MTADLFRVLRLWLERSGWLVMGIIVTVISALAGVALLAFAGKLVAASVGGAESAGIVLGLRVPMALTSRADNAMSRLASAALLRLMAPA